MNFSIYPNKLKHSELYLASKALTRALEKLYPRSDWQEWAAHESGIQPLVHWKRVWRFCNINVRQGAAMQLTRALDIVVVALHDSNDAITRLHTLFNENSYL